MKINNFNKFINENYNKIEVENIAKLMNSGQEDSFDLAITLIGDDSDLFIKVLEYLDLDIISNNLELISKNVPIDNLSDSIIDKLKIDKFYNISDIDFKVIRNIRTGKLIFGLSSMGNYRFDRNFSFGSIYVSYQIQLIMDEEEISFFPEYFIRVGDYRRNLISGNGLKIEVTPDIEEREGEIIDHINHYSDKFNSELNSELKENLKKEL